MVEWQPVNEKGIIESEDYHLVKPLIIIDSGKKTSMDAKKKWIKV